MYSDLGPGQSDNISRMITLSVITLSGFHCTSKLDNKDLHKLVSLYFQARHIDLNIDPHKGEEESEKSKTFFKGNFSAIKLKKEGGQDNFFTTLITPYSKFAKNFPPDIY
jgi:hypothetical protein